MIRGALRRLRDGVTRLGSLIRDGGGSLPAIRVVLATLAGATLRRLGRAIPGPDAPVRMRIGVDVRPFYEPLTGVGWYLYEILGELAGREDVDLVLFGDALEVDGGPALHTNLPRKLAVTNFPLQGLAVPPLARSFARAVYPALIWLEKCDLIFGANYFLPRPMSAAATRRVVTVHDFTFRRYPQMLQAETLENLNREMKREIARADAVICVSEATRLDLIELYPIDPSRAVTILSGLRQPLGAGEPVDGLPERYILFVSTIEPRKNLEALLAAFESLLDQGRYDGDLVVVGRVGWKSEAIVSRMASSRWRRRIHHLDYLIRSQLAHIYEHAGIFVLPSHYEGFGFPLLEAMSCGVPSIAARTSSLPEVGGDGALYFDPNRPDELASILVTLVEDEVLRREMSERARRRAAEFRWERSAEQTLTVFRKAIGR